MLSLALMLYSPSDPTFYSLQVHEKWKRNHEDFQKRVRTFKRGKLYIWGFCGEYFYRNHAFLLGSNQDCSHHLTPKHRFTNHEHKWTTTFSISGPPEFVHMALSSLGSKHSVFTFNFEVVSSKSVGFKAEGQRGVGLIEEQVHLWQLNAVPLKHRTQHLSVDSGNIQFIHDAAWREPHVLPSPLTSGFSFSSQGRFLCWCPRWGRTSGWSTPCWGPAESTHAIYTHCTHPQGGSFSPHSQAQTAGRHGECSSCQGWRWLSAEQTHGGEAVFVFCMITYISVSAWLLLPQLHPHGFNPSVKQFHTWSHSCTSSPNSLIQCIRPPPPRLIVNVAIET